MADADRLHPDDIEAIAHRLVELLRDEPRPPAWQVVDTATAARMLSLSPEAVRDAADLGAMRLHDGPRAPLRFDVHRLRQAVETRRIDRPATPSPRRRPGPKHRAAAAGFDPNDVLPLPEEAR